MPLLFPRPAPLCKNQSLRVQRASEQACELERLVAFRTGRQQTRTLQGIRCTDFQLNSVSRTLHFFVHHPTGISEPKGGQKCPSFRDSRMDRFIPAV